MSLIVYTAQYRYNGEDRLDITVRGKDPFGRIFAPTWEMVNGYKNKTLSEKDYIRKYDKIINDVSIIAWDHIFSLKKITLVCFCKPETFCHRVLLAKKLEEMGATYKGERRGN